MQQHWKSMHRKHPTKVQTKNDTVLQWSSKACQAWWKIWFMRQTLCNPIQWCKSIPRQPTWRNNLHHHLATQLVIIVVKTFATKNCALCAKERIAILKQFRSNPQLLFNSNNEIYNVCRHRQHFHVCVKQTTPSTDESINEKRASPTHEVNTDFTRCTNWEHSEDQQKEIIFYLFPKH